MVPPFAPQSTLFCSGLCVPTQAVLIKVTSHSAFLDQLVSVDSIDYPSFLGHLSSLVFPVSTLLVSPPSLTAPCQQAVQAPSPLSNLEILWCPPARWGPLFSLDDRNHSHIFKYFLCDDSSQICSFLAQISLCFRHIFTYLLVLTSLHPPSGLSRKRGSLSGFFLLLYPTRRVPLLLLLVIPPEHLASPSCLCFHCCHLPSLAIAPVAGPSSPSFMLPPSSNLYPFCRWNNLLKL